MSETGLQVFDHTVQKTNSYLNDFVAILGIEDKETAFTGLRTTMHCLRDRLPAEEAAQLGAQLPILLAGFYYEGWKIAATPTKERTLDKFLTTVKDNLPQGDDYPVSTENLIKAVFKFLSDKVTQGEIEEVVHMMPADLKPLWPESIRA